MEKQKDMNGNFNRICGRVLRYVGIICACVWTIKADFAIYIINQGASTVAANEGQNTVVLYNGSPLYAWGAHGAIAPAGYITRNVTGQTPGGTIELQWPNSSGTNLYINVGSSSPDGVPVGSTGWVAQNFSGSTGHYAFDIGGAAPSLCADLVVVNNRSVPIIADFYHTSDDTVPPLTSTFVQTYTVEANTQLELPLGPVPSGSEYNVFMIYKLSASGSEHYEQLLVKSQWDTDCSTPASVTNSVKPLITFPGDGVSSSNTVGGLGFGQNNGTDTNGVQEGTAKQGFGAVYTAIQDGNERQAEQLDAIIGSLTNIAGASTNAEYATGSQVDTNLSSDAMLGAVSGATNTLNTLAGNIMGITNFSGLDGSGHDASRWLAQLNTPLGVINWNFNPFALNYVSTTAQWVKGIVAWFSAWLLLRFMVIKSCQAVFHAGAFAQTTAPVIGGNFLGFGVSSSLFLHFPIAIIIGLSLASLFSLTATFLSGYGIINMIMSNPFSTAHPWIIEGMWMLNQFIDIKLALVHGMIGTGYMVFLMVHAIITQMTIRSMPGCIIVGFIGLSANAAPLVEIDNGSGAQLYVVPDGVGGSFALPVGETLKLPQYSGGVVGFSTQYNSVAVASWTNSIPESSEHLRVIVADDLSGGLAVVAVSEGDYYEGFVLGLQFGSLLLFLSGLRWIMRALKPNNIGEVRE